MEFVPRKMGPDDKNFILNSWLLSGRRFSEIGASRDYFDRREPRLHAILDESEVIVMCNSDEPRQIFGWICFDSRFRLIHFVYVRKKWRGLGLTKQLVNATGMDPQFCTTCCGVNHPKVSYIGEL